MEIKNGAFVTYIDKVLSLYGEGVGLSDYKTANTDLPNFINHEHWIQMHAEAYIWWKESGQMPKHISIEYLRFGQSVFSPITQREMDLINGIVK